MLTPLSCKITTAGDALRDRTPCHASSGNACLRCARFVRTASKIYFEHIVKVEACCVHVSLLKQWRKTAGIAHPTAVYAIRCLSHSQMICSVLHLHVLKQNQSLSYANPVTCDA